jgi:mono/diheme cytochrome c family protein
MSITAIAGITFLAVGFAAMFLMMHLWGYPFDKEKRKSAAPKWAMLLHRVLGYVFAVIYIFMMWHMVPRLWEYQVEFPARTAIHIVIGFTIGFLLLIKISIMRFFRHFEEWMPMLGISIMLLTVILSGLSLPVMFQERALASGAPGGDAMSKASRARVAELLATAGLPEKTDLVALSSEKSLRAGRDVLLGNCVRCHDLKTILAKPRMPKGWWDTVSRMAEKPALFAAATELESMQATAYLIAINSDLQKSRKMQQTQGKGREEALSEIDDETAQAAGQPGTSVAVVPVDPTAPVTPTVNPVASPVVTEPPVNSVTPTKPPTPVVAAKPPAPAIDLVKAKAVFNDVCSQCHPISDIDAAPPRTASAVRAMVRRMISEEGAELTPAQVRYATAWMMETYVKK